MYEVVVVGERGRKCNSVVICRESELNTHRYLNGLSGDTGKSIASPKLHQPFAMSEMLVEPVDDEVGCF